MVTILIVGPPANYAIAKNFFNFEGLGLIDADIPLVCELESFVTTSKIRPCSWAARCLIE